MAEDLQAYLDHRVVSAYETGSVAEIKKWVARNRGLAASLAAAASMVLLLAIGSMLAAAHFRHQETEQRELAGRNLELAAEAKAEAARARKLLYAGDMQLAANVWQSEAGTARQVQKLLEQHVPGPGEEDLRDFAWYYHRNLLENSGRTLAEKGEAAFTAADRLVTVTADPEILHWDASGHRVERRVALAPFEEKILSPDGGFLASPAAGGGVRVTDVETGEVIRVLESSGSVAAAFSPDGRFLAAFETNYQAVVREVSTGGEVARFPLGSVYYARWGAEVSPDGRALLLSNHPGNASVAVVSAEGIRSFARHDSTVRSVALSPDGRVAASGDSGGQVFLWDFESQKEIVRIVPHGSRVTALRFSRDGRYLATGGSEGLVTVWDWGERERLFQLKGHTDEVRRLYFSGDASRLASSSFDTSGLPTSKLWNLASHHEVRTVGESTMSSTDGSYSRDGRWLALARGRYAELWSTRPLFPVRKFPGSGYSVAFSPEGRFLAAGSYDSHVAIWEVETGRERFASSGIEAGSSYRRPVASLAFSPEGKFLAAGYGGRTWNQSDHDVTVRVWDVAAGREVAGLAHRNTVPALVFTPDGAHLATASHDRSVRLWNVKTWEEDARFTADELLNSLALSPDGKTLVAGDQRGLLHFWDLPSGRAVRTLDGHAFTAASLAFSPDGKILASGSWDRTVRLWDVASGREVCALAGHTEWVLSVVFSPDGRTLVSCGADHARLWPTRPPLWDDPVEAARVVSEELDRTADWRTRAQLFEQIAEREAVQLELLAQRPADPLLHATRARLLERQGKGDPARAARARARELFQDIIERPGATERLAGVFADFLAGASLDSTFLPLRVAAASGGQEAEVLADGTLRIHGTAGAAETYAVALEGEAARLSGLKVEALPGDSLTGPGVDPGQMSLRLVDLVLRARAATGAEGAEEVALRSSSAGLVAGRRPSPAVILPEEALSLPEGAILELEFSLETAGGEGPPDLRLRFSASAEEDLPGWQSLGRILGYHEVHGWLALAAAASLAGEGARARAALENIDREALDGPDLALLALTHHQLGEGDAAREWHERFLRELEKNELTPFLEDVARWVMTDVAGRSPAEIDRTLVQMDYEFQFSKLTAAIAEAPGDAGAYAARGDLSAAHGRWERALEDLRKVAELNPEDHWNIHHIGALLAWLEDGEAYRDFCEMMLSRWNDSETPYIAERTAKACLLLPTSDPGPIDPLMTTILSVDESHWAYMYFLMLKGLHEYRHGRHESALAAARESRRRFTSRFVRFIATNHAIEAMAHFRLGRPDEARQSIAELERLVNEEMLTLESGKIDVRSDAGYHGWHDWLIAHILHREAQRLLAENPPPPD